MPCTFLKNSVCTIYPVRPLACRTHFNLSDDPSLCDIVNKPGAEVPYFNFTALHVPFAQSFLEEPFADIREFFP